MSAIKRARLPTWLTPCSRARNATLADDIDDNLKRVTDEITKLETRRSRFPSRETMLARTQAFIVVIALGIGLLMWKLKLNWSVQTRLRFAAIAIGALISLEMMIHFVRFINRRQLVGIDKLLANSEQRRQELIDRIKEVPLESAIMLYSKYDPKGNHKFLIQDKAARHEAEKCRQERQYALDVMDKALSLVVQNCSKAGAKRIFAPIQTDLQRLFGSKSAAAGIFTEQLHETLMRTLTPNVSTQTPTMYRNSRLANSTARRAAEVRQLIESYPEDGKSVQAGTDVVEDDERSGLSESLVTDKQDEISQKDNAADRHDENASSLNTSTSTTHASTPHSVTSTPKSSPGTSNSSRRKRRSRRSKKAAE